MPFRPPVTSCSWARCRYGYCAGKVPGAGQAGQRVGRGDDRRGRRGAADDQDPAVLERVVDEHAGVRVGDRRHVRHRAAVAGRVVLPGRLGLELRAARAGRAYALSRIRRAPGPLGPAALVRRTRQVGAADRGDEPAGRRVLHAEPVIAGRGGDDHAGVLVVQPVGGELGAGLRSRRSCSRCTSRRAGTRSAPRARALFSDAVLASTRRILQFGQIAETMSRSRLISSAQPLSGVGISAGLVWPFWFILVKQSLAVVHGLMWKCVRYTFRSASAFGSSCASMIAIVRPLPRSCAARPSS